MTLYKWSQVAASNATADGTINWQEGQLPGTVNDSARAMMAATAKYRDDIAGSTTTSGTSTAYTLTTNQGFSSLSALNNQMIAFVPHATNTGACTLNVDSLGAIPLHIAPGVALPSGTIIQGTPYAATYYSGAGELILHGGFVNPYSVPLGGMLDYIASTAPNSAFIFPYGQAISRTVYSTLFSLVGTAFGSGDGLTTFNVPDLRGCYIACPDNMGGNAAGRLTAFGSSGTTVGALGGSQSYAIAQANLPAVNFTGGGVSISGSGSASVSGSISVSGTASGTTSTESADHTHGFSGTTGSMNQNQTHSHTFSGGNGTPWGGGSGSSSPGGSTFAMNSLTMNTANIDHGHSFSGTTGGVSATHTHTFNTTVNSSGTASLSGSASVSGTTATLAVSSGGSGSALTIIPPTVLVPRILRII